MDNDILEVLAGNKAFKVSLDSQDLKEALKSVALPVSIVLFVVMLLAITIGTAIGSRI